MDLKREYGLGMLLMGDVGDGEVRFFCRDRPNLIKSSAPGVVRHGI